VTQFFTARHFNQAIHQAKQAADNGPVVVTDRGRPSHVLLTYQAYQQLQGSELSLLDALAMPDSTGAIDLPLEARQVDPPRPIDLT